MGIDTDNLTITSDMSDHAAFTAIVNSFSRRVHAIAYRMTGNAEDARDIAQDVFIRLHRSSGNINKSVPAGAWLYRMTVNRSIDYLRSRKKSEAVPIDETAKTVNISHPGPGPDVKLERKETGEKIRTLLDLLSPNQRTVFVLRDFEDFDTGEIADILECTRATVRVHLANARRKMKDALIKRYPGLVAQYGEEGGDLQ